MMAEQVIKIEGLAIIPPEIMWGDNEPRLSRLVFCYDSHHIPFKGILPRNRLVVDWESYPEQFAWAIAHRLSKSFYPNASAPQVFEQGKRGHVLIQAELLTLQTRRPLDI